MLGIVYTEFMDMVEKTFSPEVLDDVLDTPGLSTEGAFTTVGYYDHTDMIRMVTTLSKKVDMPVDDLVETFGRHLFGILSGKYPELIEGQTSALDVLETIDTAVHENVIKLYPQAELPRFQCERISPDKLKMEYKSKRPFSRLALGLMKGCGDHFGDNLKIDFSSSDTDGWFMTEFTVCKVNE